MCGINGILQFEPGKQVLKSSLLAMRDTLLHRGPNSSGFFIDDGVGLGFRRLSILDLTDAGNQPMVSEDGRYVIVFNGEIYNFKDFYPELKAKQIVLRSTSDTEVLLNLYRLYGADMLHRLNGMFAFAIWDKQQRELFIARDRMGVKPLFYAIHDNALYFASEPKAIFCAGVPLQVAEDNLMEYLSCRFVGGDQSMFKGVNRLLPGHFLRVKHSGQTTNTRWWKLDDEIRKQQETANSIEWFRETFDSSIRLRMISDVPVGVLLSGGLDSGSIVASLKSNQFSEVETFTIGFSRHEHDETEMARILTRKFGFKFNPLILEEENLHQHFIDATWFCDEPLVHLNEPHLLAISRLARYKVTVLLSGEGADEMLGGYVRYKPLRYASLLPNLSLPVKMGLLSNDRWKKLMRYSKLRNRADLIMYNASNIFPDEVKTVYGIEQSASYAYRQQILNEAKALYPSDLQRQALYFDQHLYLCSLLDRNDRTTMGASIECREPFLDPRLLVGAGKLPTDMLLRGKKGKYILLESMRKRLPEETLNFRKIGFSVPWGQYFRENELFRDELDNMQRSKMFAMKYLEHINPGELVAQFQRGNNAMLPFLLPLMSLYIWYKYYPQKLQENNYRMYHPTADVA